MSILRVLLWSDATKLDSYPYRHPSDNELLERIPQSIDTREDDSSVIKRFGIDPSTKLTAKEWLLQRLNPTYTGRKSAA